MKQLFIIKKLEISGDFFQIYFNIIRVLILYFCITPTVLSETKIAISIGISDYKKSSGFTKLKYSDKDANDMASLLEKNGYYTKLIQNQDATANEIKVSVEEISKLYSPSDTTFLLFFSGHGYESNNLSYLATSGLTNIEVGDLISKIQEIGFKNVIFIIDACRNNLPKNSKSGYSIIKPFLGVKKKGINIIYSTEEGKYSYEDDDFKNGIFTHFLKLFLEENPHSLTNITVQDTATFLEKNVSSYTFEKQYRPLQIPEIFSIGVSNSVIIEYSYIEPVQLDISDKINFSIFEVSNAEYDLCVKDDYCSPPIWKSNKISDHYKKLLPDLKNNKFPVVGINWIDANKYAEWLSKKTNKNYRLPTLSEWKRISEMKINLREEMNCLDCNDNNNFLQSVKPDKVKNQVIYHMMGNVWEFTSTNRKEKQDNLASGYNKSHAIVGGAWSTHKSVIEDKFIKKFIPSWSSVRFSNTDIGFRLIQDK